MKRLFFNATPAPTVGAESIVESPDVRITVLARAVEFLLNEQSAHAQGDSARNAARNLLEEIRASIS